MTAELAVGVVVALTSGLVGFLSNRMGTKAQETAASVGANVAERAGLWEGYDEFVAHLQGWLRYERERAQAMTAELDAAISDLREAARREESLRAELAEARRALDAITNTPPPTGGTP